MIEGNRQWSKETDNAHKMRFSFCCCCCCCCCCSYCNGSIMNNHSVVAKAKSKHSSPFFKCVLNEFWRIHGTIWRIALVSTIEGTRQIDRRNQTIRSKERQQHAGNGLKDDVESGEKGNWNWWSKKNNEKNAFAALCIKQTMPRAGDTASSTSIRLVTCTLVNWWTGATQKHSVQMQLLLTQLCVCAYVSEINVLHYVL